MEKARVSTAAGFPPPISHKHTFLAAKLLVTFKGYNSSKTDQKKKMAQHQYKTQVGSINFDLFCGTNQFPAMVLFFLL